MSYPDNSCSSEAETGTDINGILRRQFMYS